MNKLQETGVPATSADHGEQSEELYVEIDLLPFCQLRRGIH